jgi:hypothetical protein
MKTIKEADGTDTKFDGVRSPHTGEFVRVHPGEDRRRECLFLFDNEGVMHLVAKHMEKAVEEKTHPGFLLRAVLFHAQNKDGVNFLWPVPVPVPDDCIVFDAMKGWVVLTDEPESSVH